MSKNTTTITRADHHDQDIPDKDAAVLMVSCVVGVIANFFVMYLILTVRRLKSVTNVFVFSTCLCNVMVSAILLPMEVFKKDSQGWIYKLAHRFINLITILIYICNLTAVSYDRLLSITQPMVYQLKQTRKRAIIIVMFMWIIPLIYGLLPLFWIFKPREQAVIHNAYLTITLVVFLLGPLIYIVYVYVRVCFEMKKMSALKTKLMTPTQKNMVGKQKRRSKEFDIFRYLQRNIFRCIKKKNHLTKGMDSFDGRTDSFEKFNGTHTITERSVRCLISNAEDCCETVAHQILETHSKENLPPLIEGQDKPADNIKYSTNVKNSPRFFQTPLSGNKSCKKINIVAFDDKPGSLTVEVKREAVNASKRRNARSSIFSSFETSLSPLTRKRQSSVARIKDKAKELKASFAFLIVAITYMFTWLPVVALTFDEVLGHHYLPSSLVTISLYAIAINALTDPFIYGLLLPNFRKTLKIMFRKITRNH